MSWNKLTNLGGETVYIQTNKIVMIRQARHGEFPCQVGAVLELSGYGSLPVLEDCANMLEGCPLPALTYWGMAAQA